MAPTGSRSRNGCGECRRRKQRCGEQKPSCLGCRRRGAACLYPNLTQASPRYTVLVADHHLLLPIDPAESPSSFIHLSSDELQLVCPQYAPDSSDQYRPCLARQQLRLPSWMPKGSWNYDASTESLLIQYYLEVISASKVYVPTESNLFFHLVIPVLVSGDGPVCSAILSMSAVEWSRRDESPMSHSYLAAASHYKVNALRQLQKTLQDRDRAEESLLACVLLASLEIAQGSQSTWLQHVRGALAILETAGNRVSAASTARVLRYIQFRYVLLKTTELHLPGAFRSSPAKARDDEAVTRLLAARLVSQKSARELVDPHLGCSLEMLDLVCQVSILEDRVGDLSGSSPDDELCTLGLSLEQKISELPIEVSNDVDDYLLHSAECFRTASLIYLELVIFRRPPSHEKAAALQTRLLQQLGIVISQYLPRRSFPMWPLFIAGCASVLDDQRKIVLQFFEILETKWPISNIATVSRAIWTIWQTRDLGANTLAACPDDWKQVIQKFGWKLSLS